MSENRDKNWTQRKRLAALNQTAEYVRMWGGWPAVLADREGFEIWLAGTLGCTKGKAAEYIVILRGTQVFEAKMRDAIAERDHPVAKTE
ncbi:hypothetical protein MUO79_05825 [Candidatus Bathyarchaeota archaeon]|nr:hypothetical protein [Candidatus Bathyarchaeota archaeon]